MADFVTLSCPSCGGKLEITNDIERFACAHCGHEHLVKRTGGLVTIAPVLHAIEKVGVGVDKTAAELAIVRLQKEIDEVKTYRRNFLPKEKPDNGLSICSFFAIPGMLIILLGFSPLNEATGVICTPIIIILGISLCIFGVKFIPKASREIEIWEKRGKREINKNS